MANKYGRFYARSESNVVAQDDEFLSIAKLVTSGYSGLLALIGVGIFANFDKLSSLSFSERIFIVSYSAVLVFEIITLSISIIFLITVRSLSRQMIACDDANIPKSLELTRAFDNALLQFRRMGLTSLWGALACLIILPIGIGIYLF